MFSPCNRPKKMPRAFGGFTLVELLVAMVLLGLLSLGLTGLLENTEGSVESGDRVMTHNTRLRSLDAVLGAAIAEMREVRLTNNELMELPTDMQDLKGQQGLLRANLRFLGDEHRMGFCLASPLLFGDSSGELHWVELFVKEQGEEGAGALVMRETPFLRLVDEPFKEETEEGEPLPVRELVLMQGVREVTFRYTVTRRRGFTAAEAWEYTTVPLAAMLPTAIEIELTLRNGATEILTYDIGNRFEEWMRLSAGREIADVRQEGNHNPF